MTVWNAGTFLELDYRMATGITSMLFINICYVGICFVPVAALFLGKVILQADWQPRLLHALFLVIPVLSIAVVVSNPLHHMFFVHFSLYSSDAVYGPYFYVHSLYSYGCITAAVVFMIIATARNSGIFSRQSLLIILGLFITVVPNVLYTFNINNLPFSISSAAFTVTLLCFAVAFLRYRFITALPITLRQVVDLISDGYLVVDKQFCILSYNQSLLKLFSEPFSIALGESIRPFIEKYFIDTSYDRFLELQAQSEAQLKTVIAEGHLINDKYVSVEITPVIQRNSLIGSIVLLKDITQSKLLITATREASRAKSDFLAKMSHEIRTPMNAIIGMTELALRETEAEVKNEHIHTIKQAGSNLLAIINDILDFSKIETGKLELVQENYLLSSLINDVISIIRMRIIDKEIRFVVNVDKDIPGTLYGDEVRIRQALLNILNNAVKYTDRGFVSMTAYGKFVEENTINLIIEVTDSGRGIKQEDIKKLFEDFMQLDLNKNKGIEGVGLGLSITQGIVKATGGSIGVKSEYGKGSTFTITLPQKYQTREALAAVADPDAKSVLLFERREIYANSIMKTVDNLGVSCILVSDHSELHEKLISGIYSYLFISFKLFNKSRETIIKYGSSMKVVVLTEFGEAIPDKNLSVLAMPVYSISIANLLNGVQESFSYNTNKELTARFFAPEAKVLVVDDINTNLKVAQGLMLPYGVKVELCKNGLSAIEAVRSNRYDMVFMDHKMPGMDGVEATHCIRDLSNEDPYYKNLPIVALTANAVSGTKEYFLKNGFNDYLSKPIDTVELNLILEKWIPLNKQKAPLLDEKSKKAGMEKDTGTYTRDGLGAEGLNVEKGISISGGSKDSYMRLLGAFYVDGQENLKKIRDSLAEGNLPLYTTCVHGLKSAAMLIGADELSEKAKALEAAGKEGNMTYIAVHNPGYLQSLESLLWHINTLINENKK